MAQIKSPKQFKPRFKSRLWFAHLW